MADQEARCTVCRHTSVAAIDAALTAGVSARELARQYEDLSRHALDRHRNSGHVATALALADTAEPASGTDALDLDRLERYLTRWLDAAEREGREPNTATVTMLREARLLAHAQREANPRAVLTVDWHQDASWLRARQALAEALAPYPEAKQAVVSALAALEAKESER